MSRRALVLGLDSATFDVIDELLVDGRLPNFARILDNGVRAEMVSTFPPRTAPAWVTLMTGENPGKHGIFDFWFRETSGYDTVLTGLVNSGSYAGRTFFDVLSRRGKRIAALFVPMTFPTWEINGEMIAGPPLAPDSDRGLSFPEGVHKELGVTHDTHLFPPSLKKGIDREGTVADLFQMEELRAQAALRLWDRGDYDCLMFVLESIDIVQHHLWRYFKGGKPGRFKEVIPRFYEKADQVAGRLLNRLQDDDLLFVVSDHGMTGHPETSFNANAWLAQQGWLKFSPNSAFLPRLASLGKTMLRRLLPQHVYIELSRKVKSSQGGLGKKIRINKQATDCIDWPKTTAYRFQMPDLPVEGINLNLRGRQPQGIIFPDEAKNIRSEIKKQLLELRLTDGQSVFRGVYDREEVYWGPRADLAPDLILEFCDGFRAAGGNFTSVFTRTPKIEVSRLGGTHSVRGIFMACGKPFPKGKKLERIRILDFAPNLLYSLGQPIPAFMDGEVRRELFQQDFLDNHQICRDKTEVEPAEIATQPVVYTEAEVQQMEDKLRSLGYL